MDSFNVLPRSVSKNVLIRKKKVDSFKAASSQNPYIRTNWFVHTAVTTEISMHIIWETHHGAMKKWIKMTLGSI